MIRLFFHFLYALKFTLSKEHSNSIQADPFHQNKFVCKFLISLEVSPARQVPFAYYFCNPQQQPRVYDYYWSIDSFGPALRSGF